MFSKYSFDIFPQIIEGDSHVCLGNQGSENQNCLGILFPKNQNGYLLSLKTKCKTGKENLSKP